MIGLTTGLCGCSSRAMHEAEEVVAQADSLWHIGQTYGIDEGDSATLAHAYETLKKQSAFPFLPPFNFHFSPFNFQHSCYHYGRLLRQKDDPVSAMQVFIDATHSRTRDYHILGRVYSNMGSICHLASEFPLSYDMYQRSADCFLKNGDTTAYYFLLNDMAYELAVQEDTINVKILLDKIRQYPDSALRIKTWETEAVLYQTVNNYEVVIELIDSLQAYGYTNAVCYMMKARAFNYLCQYDSALWYAQEVVSLAPDDNAAIAAYYILSHDDQTLDTDSILNLTSARADVQKAWAYSQSKFAQAVQLLEQDLTRKPDWKWLMGIIGTLVVTGCIIGLYVYRKGKQKTLLTQKIEHLETEYIDLQANKKNQLEQTCAVLRASDNLPSNMYWKDYEKMCCFVNEHFYLLANKLKQKNILNETEIRFCVLVLLDLNRKQISQILPYALNSVGKLKDHTAKMLGSTGKNLRHFLIEMAIKG